MNSTCTAIYRRIVTGPRKGNNFMRTLFQIWCLLGSCVIGNHIWPSLEYTWICQVSLDFCSTCLQYSCGQTAAKSGFRLREISCIFIFRLCVHQVHPEHGIVHGGFWTPLQTLSIAFNEHWRVLADDGSCSFSKPAVSFFRLASAGMLGKRLYNFETSAGLIPELLLHDQVLQMGLLGNVFMALWPSCPDSFTKA